MDFQAPEVSLVSGEIWASLAIKARWATQVCLVLMGGMVSRVRRGFTGKWSMPPLEPLVIVDLLGQGALRDQQDYLALLDYREWLVCQG